MAIGFKNNQNKKDAKESSSEETYHHTIRFFGIPIINITKKHNIDSSVEE